MGENFQKSQDMNGINFNLWEKIANFAYHHDDTIWWKLLEGLFCPQIEIGAIHILMVVQVPLKLEKNCVHNILK